MQLLVRVRSRSGLSAPAAVDYAVGLTHGVQLTRAMVGPTGPLTEVGPVTTSRDGQVLRGLRIVGGLDVRHHVTVEDCEIVGLPTAASAGYTVRHVKSTGRVLTMRRTAVITRSGATKGLVSYGTGYSVLEDCLVVGGTDGLYLKPSTAAADGGPAHRLTRCWVGDLQATSGSHSDCVQVDGGAGGVLVDRCRLTAVSLPAGSDPLTAAAPSPPTLADLGNAGLILTYPSTAPEQIANVTVVDTHLDGGNYCLNTSPPDGPAPVGVQVARCTFGLNFRYGPMVTGSGQAVMGNRWATSGATLTGQQVTAGQMVG